MTYGVNITRYIADKRVPGIPAKANIAQNISCRLGTRYHNCLTKLLMYTNQAC